MLIGSFLELKNKLKKGDFALGWHLNLSGILK